MCVFLNLHTYRYNMNMNMDMNMVTWLAAPWPAKVRAFFILPTQNVSAAPTSGNIALFNIAGSARISIFLSKASPTFQYNLFLVLSLALLACIVTEVDSAVENFLECLEKVLPASFIECLNSRLYLVWSAFPFPRNKCVGLFPLQKPNKKI